jgi:hypothetical protein
VTQQATLVNVLIAEGLAPRPRVGSGLPAHPIDVAIPYALDAALVLTPAEVWQGEACVWIAAHSSVPIHSAIERNDPSPITM